MGLKKYDVGGSEGEVFATLVEDLANAGAKGGRKLKLSGDTIEQVKQDISRKMKEHAGLRRVIDKCVRDQHGATARKLNEGMSRVLSQGVGSRGVAALASVGRSQSFQELMEVDDLAMKLGMKEVKGGRTELQKKVAIRLEAMKTSGEVMAWIRELEGEGGRVTESVRKQMGAKFAYLSEVERKEKEAKKEAWKAEYRSKREFGTEVREKGGESAGMLRGRLEELRKRKKELTGEMQDVPRKVNELMAKVGVLSRQKMKASGRRRLELMEEMKEIMDEVKKLRGEAVREREMGLKEVVEEMKEIEERVERVEMREKEKAQSLELQKERAQGMREKMTQKEKEEKRKRQEERSKRGEVVAGGDTEKLWDYVLVSGKYKGKALWWVFENRPDQFAMMLAEVKAKATPTSGLDKRMLEELLRKSQVVKEFDDSYWKDRGHLSPMDAVWMKRKKNKSGEEEVAWVRQDVGGARRKGVDRHPDDTDTHTGAMGGMRKVVKKDKFGNEMVEELSEDRRKRFEWTPERSEEERMRELRDEYLGKEVSERAEKQWEAMTGWKRTKRGGVRGWRRRNPWTLKWEFRKRHGDGWLREYLHEMEKEAVLRGLAIEMAEWEAKVLGREKLSAQEAIEKGREGAGKVLEVLMKRSKLRWMVDQGLLSGREVLMKFKEDWVPGVQEKQRMIDDVGMTEEQSQRVRAGERLSREERDVLREKRAEWEGQEVGGVQGMKRGAQFKEGEEVEVPLWRRVEEATEVGHLEEIEKELFGEYGEAAVREEGGREDTGFGLWKVIQMKKNDIAAAEASGGREGGII